MSETERIKASLFYTLIHYHCANQKCSARLEINYITHMCILEVDDDLFSRFQDCYEYHLPFKENGEWYHLIGKQEAFSGTLLRTAKNPKPMLMVDFISIPPHTLDTYGWRAFKRLKNLVVFA
jgi:hypothetical protein